jgi:NAD(P)-dependent dehydrogenase (short-subunit alcohol dehydrogenase family)
LDRLFGQIKREKNKLDVVFANAGAAEYAALGKMTEQHYDSILNINVKGLLFTMHCIPIASSFTNCFAAARPMPLLPLLSAALYPGDRRDVKP